MQYCFNREEIYPSIEMYHKNDTSELFDGRIHLTEGPVCCSKFDLEKPTDGVEILSVWSCNFSLVLGVACHSI